MTGQFGGKVTATLRDARRLAGEALYGAPSGQKRADRHRLALDRLALTGLATHLPYDPVTAIARPDCSRATRC